jgi:DNA-directed RNA polymerase subunit M/transcription elongation factor TFIIS
MKKFNELDEDFVCEYCHSEVSPLIYSSRDHCPICLYSKHVDINPGDRKNNCKGLLKPIGIEKFRDTYKILYKCEKCGQLHKNIMAKESVLEYEVIKRNKEKNKTLVKINLKTGRHHQIRVQFATRNHPLAGDQRYGKADKTQIALYAYKLEFIHPTTKEKLSFELLPQKTGHWTDFTM